LTKRKSKNNYGESRVWINKELINTNQKCRLRNQNQNQNQQSPPQQQLNDPSVNVFAVFTSDSQPSDTNGRQERFARDIASANQIWGQCNISFIPQPIIEVGEIIDATGISTDPTPFTPGAPMEELIRNAQQQISDPTGIWVVYTSGDAFSDGFTIGHASIIFDTFFVNGFPEFIIYGAIALTNGALNVPFAFAHEAGHVLFTELIGNTFESNDPTGPYIDMFGFDPGHSNIEGNLMAPIIPNAPTIDQLQCEKANMSVLFQSGT
jgi:hypothetical protein